MREPKYILEKYSGSGSRYTCPACKKHREFTRYVNVQTGQYLHSTVGRCNRQDKCGYHYPPKQYFLDNNIVAECDRFNKCHNVKSVYYKEKSPSHMPVEKLEASLTEYNSNYFVRFLMKRFGKEITTNMITKYFLGTSNLWPGATLFWQIDIEGKVRTGKIMLYDAETGKRVRQPSNYISWTQSVEKYKNYQLRQCLYGEHLLQDVSKPVAIVESEKTAIVASAYLPDFIWLATGGKDGLTSEKLRVLSGRNLILYPDLSIDGKVFKQWSVKANELEQRFPGTRFLVSDILEKNASNSARNDGWDLADYLLNNDILDNIAIRKKKGDEDLTWYSYECEATQFCIN